MKLVKREGGFTLIELLIVIVIIGILAAVVIAVINPGAQQQKAKNAAMRANVQKGCMALFACGSTTSDARNCDTRAEAGILAKADMDGNPAGAAYGLTTNANSTSDAPATSANATVYFTGQIPDGGGNCQATCSYNFGATGTTNPVTNMTTSGCSF